MDLAELRTLAGLIRERNVNEVGITGIIGRPALPGHVGEYVASRIFDIALHGAATHPGSDGRFRSGRVAGKSVNIKMYARRENILDIKPHAPPDYYLVLTGPKAAATSSRGAVRPWGIREVFLFDAARLIDSLRTAEVSIGVATSVRDELWESARIHPTSPAAALQLTAAQQTALGIFDL